MHALIHRSRTPRNATARARFALVASLLAVRFLAGCVLGGGPHLTRGLATDAPAPPPRAEQRSPRPGRDATWIAGYWHWTGREYAWISGHWETPP